MESVVQAGVRPRAERASVLPWYLVSLLFGSTSIIVGLLWDISWHMSIGRDTFWTPAHMAIYLGGVLAGISGGWLALGTTFGGTPEARAVAVRFWGFRAPLGAWVAIWGALAMLTSAPFDDWWHNAYGLDVKIISPPHSVLAAGMIAIQIGAMLLALAWQNRAREERPEGARPLEIAFLYAAGVILLMLATMLMEYVYPNDQHAARFYKVTAAAFPVLLVAVARASRLRWAATLTAAFYMAIALAMVWILPLFPAQPMLAPINNPIDRMVPPLFPMLLVVPALALDLVFWRAGKRSRWWLAPVLAAVFVAVFFVTQWSFSSFQLSPAARNRFFVGDMQWTYSNTPGPWQHEFWDLEEDPVTPGTLGRALLLATGSSLVGLGWGAWMARVKR